MPSPQYVSIANGQSVSSMFVLDRSDRRLAVHIASHAAAQFTLAFAASSGGTFARLTVDGTGAPWLVLSGTAGAWSIVMPPTPFGRVEALANLSATTTCTLLMR